MKIERDYGNGNLQVAYEYGYNSDGAKVWKRDTLNQQEYRYLCRIGCGGVLMRVYNRASGGASWASVEDYLPVGNALGYGWNWRFHYAGGTVLMMGITGEPNSYHPTDSNGVAVQSHPPSACACLVVPTQVATCDALGYGGCEGGRCDEENPAPLPPSPSPLPLPFPKDLHRVAFLGFKYGNWCGAGHPGHGRIYNHCKPGISGGFPGSPHPPAKDEVDACCCKHDECYDVNNCTPICWFKCACRQCDCDLANCLARANCAGSPLGFPVCERARRIIKRIMDAACNRPCHP